MTKEELQAQAQNLQATKDQLDAQSQELANADKRDAIAGQAQQLMQMQQNLQDASQDIARRSQMGADGVEATAPKATKVTKDTIKEMNRKLEEYKKGKKNLDERIKNNQDWWMLRHYGQLSTKDGTLAVADPSQKNDGRPKSVTAWTINAIINKHADYMDNFPEAICLPVEANDEPYANKLSAVLPAIYERADYEQTYSDASWYKLIAGTSVTGYFWDKTLLNGLGDVSIKKCDILNLFWEQGVMDIQDSEYFFHLTLMTNDKIKQMYPDIEVDLTASSTIDKTKYNTEDYDGHKEAESSYVIDCYYHRINSNGKRVLHLCKYVNETILYASENEPAFAEKGYYAHGEYPFVFDTMFPVEGSPCGFGYIDILKDPQKDIDELTDNFMRNAKGASHRRYVVNDGSGVNEEELADETRPVVHLKGSLNEDNFRQLSVEPLSPIYMNLYDNRINEMKEVANNRDVSSGGTVSGVTAASAIAAMQEQGSKTSRDQEASAYRAFKKGCYYVIELIAENYTETRYFRVMGDNGQPEYIGLNNSGIGEAAQPDANGNETSRKPIFDIKVKPQKRSQYSTLQQNEFMKELWAAGVFNPQAATPALAFLSVLEFEGKDNLIKIISQNGTIYDQLIQYQQIVMQMAQQLDMLSGGTTNYTAQAETAINNGQIPMIQANANQIRSNASETGNSIADKAKAETRQRAEVRA